MFLVHPNLLTTMSGLVAILHLVVAVPVTSDSSWSPTLVPSDTRAEDDDNDLEKWLNSQNKSSQQPQSQKRPRTQSPPSSASHLEQAPTKHHRENSASTDQARGMLVGARQRARVQPDTSAGSSSSRIDSHQPLRLPSIIPSATTVHHKGRRHELGYEDFTDYYNIGMSAANKERISAILVRHKAHFQEYKQGVANKTMLAWAARMMTAELETHLLSEQEFDQIFAVERIVADSRRRESENRTRGANERYRRNGKHRP